MKPDETNCIFLLPFQTDCNSCPDDFQVGRAWSLAISPKKLCAFGMIRVGHACSLIFPQSCPGTSQGLVSTLRDRLNYLLLTDEDFEAWRDGVTYVPKARHSHDSNSCLFWCYFPLCPHWIPSLIGRTRKTGLSLLSPASQLYL